MDNYLKIFGLENNQYVLYFIKRVKELEAELDHYKERFGNVKIKHEPNMIICPKCDEYMHYINNKYICTNCSHENTITKPKECSICGQKLNL